MSIINIEGILNSLIINELENSEISAEDNKDEEIEIPSNFIEIPDEVFNEDGSTNVYRYEMWILRKNLPLYGVTKVDNEDKAIYMNIGKLAGTFFYGDMYMSKDKKYVAMTILPLGIDYLCETKYGLVRIYNK